MVLKFAFLESVALELGHFSKDLLPSMLLEQTALSSEVSDFHYRGVVELCDDFNDFMTCCVVVGSLAMAYHE